MPLADTLEQRKVGERRFPIFGSRRDDDGLGANGPPIVSCPHDPQRSNYELKAFQPVEREWLAETLWSDMDQIQTFSNLRRILSELRTSLEKEAVRLLGAFGILQTPMDAPLKLAERERFEQLLLLAHSFLEDEAFTVAWETGQSLGWEQAIEHTLDITAS